MTLAEARLRINQLTNELADIRHLREDAARVLVAYEQMRGQVMSMTQSINSLKQAEPGAWERHFSKKAKRDRKLKAPAQCPPLSPCSSPRAG